MKQPREEAEKELRDVGMIWNDDGADLTTASCLITERLSRNEWKERAEKAEARVKELAAGILAFTETIKYLKGIVEHGTGQPQAEDETVEQYVLGYVKGLETGVKELEAKIVQAKRTFDECVAICKGEK